MTVLGSVCTNHESQQAGSTIIRFICSDEASSQLLLAYCYATSAKNQRNDAAAEQQRLQAQGYFGRGTNLLWNRLQDPSLASSDINIQAVLLLVAYAADFGQATEVGMHVDALRVMVEERGGIEAIDNSTLRSQLEVIPSTRRWHLTFTSLEDCSSPLRFPHGFWQLSPQAN